MMQSGNKTETLQNGIIVVTGTSTGIGNATAKELASCGFHVLAGVRREIDADAIRGKNIEPVMLDITNEATTCTLHNWTGCGYGQIFKLDFARQSA
ncbi:NADP-dependent 3-hydroxy acid dehydrogenase YdfG [Algoriphagus sp. 4150]|uniref:SDR family NAD(P)-dependent oxidoreductase n=1 Tax=Algoriphagus sp. 4150 TaxID=2817756 RepID=UPI00285AF8E2|nr:SDR family NAD(P)-dependent oxidoreductase [Algoriphagus sp. 4150]MDR7128057.1 NADP-dependent 3-hydroxy acid dehydrogenase YdfG [Algoriphagus sp. 4150]